MDEFIEIFKRRIIILPEAEFVKYREKVTEICPNKKDITYFALALYLKCPIWSNEKILKNQKNIIVYATHDLMNIFNIN